jgi:hypothetical protein
VAGEEGGLVTEPTTERLARALEAADAPKAMVVAARVGCYDDFKSESATPCMDLVRDLMQAARETWEQPLRGNLIKLAQRAKLGEFDATREESEAWAAEARKDPEMARVLDALERKP